MKACINCHGDLNKCVDCRGMSHWHAAPDPVVDRVREKLAQRSRAGMQKYGTTLERPDMMTRDWLIHAQEEALDLANYLQVLIDRHNEKHQG